MAVAELVDTGCDVHLYRTGFDIDYKGETLYKGWQEWTSRLWRMSLEDNGGSRLTPNYNADEYDVSSGHLCQLLQYSANNIYECENKNQLIKY